MDGCIVPVECGKATIQPDITTRIVGGTEAIPNSWPWQCNLRTPMYGDGLLCAATVIDRMHVLTAAHCV